tara:strand:+ start:2399 stop:4270 length:1872 start_codon:yes stop_codon:yes gene_type:complete
MLTRIRENLSTWVITVLVILIAIPLVFMGLGDYQSAGTQYAIKINDQTISNSQIDQEVFQYRQALQKNFGGQIPPVYTDNFIKDLTVNYIVRTTLLDQMSRDMGLAFHNKSIIEEIYNTSAFKDQGEFNADLYKSQLFRLNMAPEVYESYVYQKGITNQLRQSITETSILTNYEKNSLIKNRFQERVINYKVFDVENYRKGIEPTTSQINEVYEENKDLFLEPAYSRYRYLDINRKNIIDSTLVDEKSIYEAYQINLDDGLYTKPNKYEIMHILIDNNQSGNSNLSELADKIYSDLNNDISFKDVISRYDAISSESRDNQGYMGKFILEDLPKSFSSAILTLKPGEISKPFISKSGIHIVSVKSIQKGETEDFNSVKLNLEREIKQDLGSKKYYKLIDEITDAIYSGNNDLSYYSQLLQTDVKESQKISINQGQGIFSYPHVREELFKEIYSDQKNITPPIFIDDDRFIVAQTSESISEQQLPLEEAEPLIREILINRISNEKLLLSAEESRNSLNAGIKNPDNTFSAFIGTSDSDQINDDLKKVFFNSNPTIGYQITNLSKDKIVLFNIETINFPIKPKNDDNYKDFMSFTKNTASESDFDRFYNMFKDQSQVEVSESIYEN